MSHPPLLHPSRFSPPPRSPFHPHPPPPSCVPILSGYTTQCVKDTATAMQHHLSEHVRYGSTSTFKPIIRDVGRGRLGDVSAGHKYCLPPLRSLIAADAL